MTSGLSNPSVERQAAGESTGSTATQNDTSSPPVSNDSPGAMPRFGSSAVSDRRSAARSVAASTSSRSREHRLASSSCGGAATGSAGAATMLGGAVGSGAGSAAASGSVGTRTGDDPDEHATTTIAAA